MAATWPGCWTPTLDRNGAPMVGATVRFYDEGTLTPQTVYSDSSLSTSLDQPVEADAYGLFPTVFLNPTPGSYRVRLLDPDGATVYDRDGISVPQDADFVPPDAGDTAEELLFRTGFLQPYYGGSAPSGWVRLNGRTIGSATSGATERANADCEDLFLHLWTEDAADELLAISGGRGASAAADWAANKTIALPDSRSRTLIARGSMGGSAVNIIGDILDGDATPDTLGGTGGADAVALVTAELPVHSHTATFTGTPVADHQHNTPVADDTGNVGSDAAAWTSNGVSGIAVVSSGAGAHTPAGTVAVGNTGSGNFHTNLQPSLIVTMLIKL